GVDFHPQIAAADLSTTPPRNILLDGVRFDGWTRTASDVHTECLQIGAGDGITIRNSFFGPTCDVFALEITEFGVAGPPKNLTIENNFFGEGGDGGFASVRFTDHASTYENVLFRNNSSIGPISIDPAPAMVNFNVIANVAPNVAGGCDD